MVIIIIILFRHSASLDLAIEDSPWFRPPLL